ncbi:alpha/beta hydrolase [Craterilacuibacter sinensis]|uniref:Alpha/beta hydrolase n=1 Tax=Craterilacuibacter sinensis TaxID=2686017 RepID=A0A845BKS9_9NEIS|nr:alpha/beta hydrolase [Craterilacuibacter sinensis]MXR37267.1 alpha/beta hydrolase [Craterilacuibacter sinensis]
MTTGLSMQSRGRVRGFFAICLLAVLAGCASAPPASVALSAQADTRWQRHALAGAGLPLVYWQPRQPLAGQTLVVYLEGDGRAYASRDIVSADPTPQQALALQLALVDVRPNIAYLGRPCQYGGADRQPCAPRYWSSHRFAPEVVDSLMRALDRLKAETGAGSLELIGYSGGGALAVLLAARRNDVVAVQTVAGNLDHVAWTRQLGLSPLAGSLNAADALPAIAHIRQTHWVGEADRVVPPALTQDVLSRHALAGSLREVAAGHQEGWLAVWQGRY